MKIKILLFVAIGFFALPYGVLLFPIQLMVMLFEFIRKRTLGFGLLIIGIIGGAFVGFLWYFVIKSSQLTVELTLLLIGIAILQSLVVFGFHLIANKLNIGNFD